MKDQEQLFRITFENAAVGMAHVDQKGHFIRVNQKLSEITGYPKEELMQKTFQEITFPEDLEDDLKQVEALSRGEIHSYSIRKRYIKKNGDILWANLTVSAVTNAKGELDFYISVIEDISKQIQAEQALQKSEERFRKVFQINTVGVLYFDMKSNFRDANDAFLRMIGYDREKLEKGELNSGLVTLPEWMPRTWEAFAELKETGLISPYEKELVRPDGSRWWGLFAGTGLDENEGAEFVIDVTERKRTEEALQRSEEKFRLIANNISQMVWMGDSRGQIFWYNNRWYDYTGQEPQNIEGLGWKELIHPDHLERVTRKLNDSAQAGEPWEDLFPLKDKNGQYHWFLSRALPQRNEKKNIIRWFGTATNVNKQIETEDQLKKDNELIENLLYIAAHDLKGPVANLYQALSIMDQLEPEKQLIFFREFHGLADQLDKTIKGLTDILRVRSSDNSSASKVDFENVLSEIMPEFNNSLGSFSLEYDFSEKKFVYYIKPFLYSIMKNFISNAIKYKREEVPLKIRINSGRKKEYVLLSISDNGIGIDLELYREKLFSPFQRFSSGKEKGTGIGLYIIKTIVEKNGGYIEVESTPGKGTTFNCFLKEYRNK